MIVHQTFHCAFPAHKDCGAAFQIITKLLFKLIESRKLGTKIDSELVEELDLQEEVTKYEQPERNFDIQLRAFWRSFALLDTKWRRANVLLTGATGFLGGFILQV